MPEPVLYHPATLQVNPETLPALRTAIEATLNELTPHLERMQDEAHIAEPWLQDSASHETWAFYEQYVMGDPQGPFQAVVAYERQLTAIRDRLVEIDAEYARNESEIGSTFESML